MPRTEKISKDAKPRYFELLNEEDQSEYTKLREQLSSPNCKNRRNKSNEVFKDIVKSIKKFAVKGDDGDWKRSLVCGIIWLTNSIAINTHQLRLLITKCKSSINGSFQALGFGTVPTGTDSAGELITKFPFLRNNFAELRQWTVRQKFDLASSSAHCDESLNPTAANKCLNTKLPATLLEDIMMTSKEAPESITPPPDLGLSLLDSFTSTDSFTISAQGSQFKQQQQQQQNLRPQQTFDVTKDMMTMITNDISTSLAYIGIVDGYEFDSIEPEHFKPIDDFEMIPQTPAVFSDDPLMFFPNMDEKRPMDIFDLGERI